MDLLFKNTASWQIKTNFPLIISAPTRKENPCEFHTNRPIDVAIKRKLITYIHPFFFHFDLITDENLCVSRYLSPQLMIECARHTHKHSLIVLKINQCVD